MPDITAKSTADQVINSLVSSKYILPGQVEAIRVDSATDGEMGRRLLAEGVITEAQLALVLERDLGYPQIDLKSYAPDEDALRLIPADVANAYRLLPLFDIDGVLTVALGDLASVFAFEEIGAANGIELNAVIGERSAVEEALLEYYSRPGAADSGSGADSRPGASGSGAADSALEAASAAPADTSGANEFTMDGLVSQAGVAPDVASSESSVSEEVPDPDISEDTQWTPEPLSAPDEVEAAAFGVEHASSSAEGFAVGELDSGPSVAADSDIADVSAALTVEQVMGSEIGEDSPSIDLDVLAVADERAVAILVTDILEAAVRRGASKIHLLPYKSDFFLVFRIRGRLEKIASAPLSMEKQLIKGFINFARLGDIPDSRPALGRVRTEIAGKDVVFSISAVPTIAGQRLVISAVTNPPRPKDLAALGMSDAEQKALHAMVERGRGLLLIAAPVGGGCSATYYALLQHAAQVGKTVYSVERSIDYEIPAAAQVQVSPGTPIPAAGYFSAGFEQDTDVLALDSIQAVDEANLAIKAAGMGKLVIVTFVSGDIVSGVRRLLDMGVEPVSLANSLTLGVGQRILRTNCTTCAEPTQSSIVSKIPGARMGIVPHEGKGCPACSGTGYSGATGIFEVLPFTEPVRTVIVGDESVNNIRIAATKAGMRSMVSSGLSKVEKGIISPNELNRVLRFAK
ncbi:MAG: Flp pilus assembly complex ATPase component TadA [Coriobacteriia bacterium]|nr:Flp pilus assembly complex ATPase component TadA [Coriobacteriia bacterium]